VIGIVSNVYVTNDKRLQEKEQT